MNSSVWLVLPAMGEKTFEGAFFNFLWSKFYFKDISASALKSCIKTFLHIFFYFFISFGQNQLYVELGA
jgi:hypothetical protein